MQKINIFGNFHITNACNYNCDGCYSLSDHNFSGHQFWEDYKDIYKDWASKIDIKNWSIHGGEPTLNPTYLDWITGLFEIWPDSKGSIRTNGSTIIPKNQKLYNFLKDLDGKVHIEISLHNKLLLGKTLSNVRQWLSSPFEEIRYPSLLDLPNILREWRKSYQNIRGDSWPDCDSPDDWDNLPLEIKQECEEVFDFSPGRLADKRLGYKFTDKNNIVVIIAMENFFSNGPLIPMNDLKNFKLYNSDPIKAHDACGNKMCGEFFKGKYYKCNTVGHFPEFDYQFNVDLSNEDRKLLYSYEPMSVDMSINELTNFFQNTIKNPIPQCKFCPENKIMTEIFADTKKIFFQKKDSGIPQNI
jgi:hypothetical protein